MYCFGSVAINSGVEEKKKKKRIEKSTVFFKSWVNINGKLKLNGLK